MTTTNPKLIPFDLDIALKHPERLRHAYGWRATQIAHFPAVPVYPVAIHWENDQSPCFYTPDGRSLASENESVVFLTAETKLVPWTSIDEVPEGVYFKNKSSTSCFVCTGYKTADAAFVYIGRTWFSLEHMFLYLEYSPNRNGPWLPCGKEVTT